MPPSIVIATPVLLGGPETMRARCVEQQQHQQAAPPPLEPPPTNGLCNSRLCVGHASVHSAIAASVLGGPEVVRVVLNSSSTATEVVRVVLNSSSSTVAAPVLGGPEVVRVVLNSNCSTAW